MKRLKVRNKPCATILLLATSLNLKLQRGGKKQFWCLKEPPISWMVSSIIIISRRLHMHCEWWIVPPLLLEMDYFWCDNCKMYLIYIMSKIIFLVALIFGWVSEPVNQYLCTWLYVFAKKVTPIQKKVPHNCWWWSGKANYVAGKVSGGKGLTNEWHHTIISLLIWDDSSKVVPHDSGFCVINDILALHDAGFLGGH